MLDAYLPAAVALIVFGIPASRLQQGYSAIIKQPSRRLQIAWVPLFIVGAILVAVVLTNVISNIKFPAVLDKAPVLGLAVWAVILATSPLRRPDWRVMPETVKGTVFLLALVLCASMMPVDKLPTPSWQTS